MTLPTDSAEDVKEEHDGSPESIVFFIWRGDECVDATLQALILFFGLFGAGWPGLPLVACTSGTLSLAHASGWDR